MVWVRPSRSRPKPSRLDQGRGVEANSGGSGGSSLPADGGEGFGGDGGTRGEGRTQQRPPFICATPVTKQRLLVGGVGGSQVSGDQRGHVVEQVSATLVPFSSRKIFLVWFFVVAPQHREQGEATETCMGLNPGSLDRNPIRLQKKQMYPPWLRLCIGRVLQCAENRWMFQLAPFTGPAGRSLRP